MFDTMPRRTIVWSANSSNICRPSTFDIQWAMDTLARQMTCDPNPHARIQFFYWFTCADNFYLNSRK